MQRPSEKASSLNVESAPVPSDGSKTTVIRLLRAVQLRRGRTERVLQRVRAENFRYIRRMACLVFLALFGVLIAAGTSFVLVGPDSWCHAIGYDEDWIAWKFEHSIVHDSTPAELAARTAWYQRLNLINEWTQSASRANRSWAVVLKHNEYSDLTWEEFTGSAITSAQTTSRRRLDTQSSSSADSRAASLGCRSSVIRAVVSSLDLQYASRFGQALPLAADEVLKCYDGPASSCPSPRNVLMWINQTGGVPSKTSWDAAVDPSPSSSHSRRRLATTGCKADWFGRTCRPNPDAWMNLTRTTVAETVTVIRDALNATSAPVIARINIEGARKWWQSYAGGVIIDDCLFNASYMTTFPMSNRTVLITGEGTVDDGTTVGRVDYWLVQNAELSSSWGERGFFRIKRGENLCGIESNVEQEPGISVTNDACTLPRRTPCFNPDHINMQTGEGAYVKDACCETWPDPSCTGCQRRENGEWCRSCSFLPSSANVQCPACAFELAMEHRFIFIQPPSMPPPPLSPCVAPPS